MITFVYKTGFEDKKKGDDYKPPRRNSKSKKLSSQPNDDSSKLSQQATDVARRDYSVATKTELVEILYFNNVIKLRKSIWKRMDFLNSA